MSAASDNVPISPVITSRPELIVTPATVNSEVAELDGTAIQPAQVVLSPPPAPQEIHNQQDREVSVFT